MDLSTVMSAKGGGKVKVSAKSHTLPSLLPNGTGQYGPLIRNKTYDGFISRLR